MPFLPILALAMLQDGFPHTPENRWAQRGIDLGVREGLVPRYTEGMYRTSTRDLKTRWEFAVYAYGSLSKQIDLTERAITGGTDQEKAAMSRAAALIPFYRRASREFASEYRQLAFDPSSLIERISNLSARLQGESPARTRLFRDVPADHWAAKAVGDLRALGLLNGYPDERFRD